MKKGSISILLLFVFLLISLSFLFLFTQLEQRILTTDNRFDRAQSGYIAESTIYQYIDDLDLEKCFKQLQHPGSEMKLPKTSVLEGTTNQAVLKTVKTQDQFDRFRLEVNTSYKNIGTKAIAHGQWIDPVFYQIDGYLTQDEIESDELLTSIIDQFELRDHIFHTIFKIEEPREIEFKNGKFLNFPMETFDVEPKGSQVSYPPYVVTIENHLKIKNQGIFNGIIRVRDGGTLEGNFNLKGVLILEPGAKSYGRIDVHGLCIDLSGDTNGIYSVFSKEETIRYLKFLNGFINPQVISLEKD